MRKIKFNRRTGSIFAFVVSSIAMMSGILMTGLKSTTYQNIFINQAAHSYPFFDKDRHGNLQVHGLFDVEKESMENLIVGVLSKDGNRFIARNGDHDKYKKIGDSLEEINKFLSKFQGCPKEIKHNDYLSVYVGIIPNDNKLPFRVEFEGEIKHALNAILKDEKIDKSKLNHQKNSRNDPIDNLNIGGITSHDVLCEHLGLNDDTNAKAYDKVKEIIKDTFVFDDRVNAMNFFAANKYVRHAILHVFCNNIERGWLIWHRQRLRDAGITNIAFDFDDENYVLKNTAKNVELLSTLMQCYSKFSSEKTRNKVLLLKVAKNDQGEIKNVDQFFSESEWINLNIRIADYKYGFFHKKNVYAVKLLW